MMQNDGKASKKRRETETLLSTKESFLLLLELCNMLKVLSQQVGNKSSSQAPIEHKSIWRKEFIKLIVDINHEI